MRSYTTILVGLWVLLLAGGSFSHEPIYPDGYDLECHYTLSDSVITFGDTLTVTRTLTNNESFSLSNLYFSDNLPPEFAVHDVTAQVGMGMVDIYSSGPQANEVVSGSETYYWVLDSPVGGEGVDYVVGAGQTVTLTMKITSSDIGTFSLPLHTTVFYGNGTGLFSISDSLQVRVTISAGVEVETDPFQLASRIFSTAYPNPFNSTLSIAYNGHMIKGSELTLDIYNVLGQRVWTKELGRADSEGLVSWETTGDIGSGVYFYHLTAGTASSRGKLLLVK